MKTHLGLLLLHVLDRSTNVLFLTIILAALSVRSATADTVTFTGGSAADSTKWEDPANWSPPRVPTYQDTVIIPPGKLVKVNGRKTVGVFFAQGDSAHPTTTITGAKEGGLPGGSVEIEAYWGSAHIDSNVVIKGSDGAPLRKGGDVSITARDSLVNKGKITGGTGANGGLDGGDVSLRGHDCINDGTETGGKGGRDIGQPRGGDGGNVNNTGVNVKPGEKQGGEGGQGTSGKGIPGKTTTTTYGGKVLSGPPGAKMVGQDVLIVDPLGTGVSSLSMVAVGDTAVLAESQAVINLCAACVVDMRGNPAGTPLIIAPLGTCIYGTVLTDPGVSVGDLTFPPAVVSASPCLLPTGVAVSETPSLAHLSPARPNPSFGRTEFTYRAPRGERVTIAIFSATGRRVRTLTAGARPVGEVNLHWDGTDDRGHKLPSGVYWCRLQLSDSGEAGVARKIVVLK